MNQRIQKSRIIQRAKEIKGIRENSEQNQWWDQFTNEELDQLAKGDSNMIEKAEKMGVSDVIGGFEAPKSPNNTYKPRF